MPALNENRQAQAKLDSLIGGCFALLRLYGKAPESSANMATITNMFHAMLGRFPADQVIRAFELWMERSQQFPTPADIISLIKRKGRPPLKESDIIAIRKKDGESRTRAEWDMLAEWEGQQSETFTEFVDPVKDIATLEDNMRLRQENMALKAENERLAALLHETRVAKGYETPKPGPQEQVERTAQHMRDTGALPEDVEAFLLANGITA